MPPTPPDPTPPGPRPASPQAPSPAHSPVQGPAPRPTGNPWIGVRFTCAGAYVRVYRRPRDPFYLARCPRCAQCVRFRVGAEGVNARIFDVSC